VVVAVATLAAHAHRHILQNDKAVSVLKYFSLYYSFLHDAVAVFTLVSVHLTAPLVQYTPMP
jgi:hypothetical protein